MKITKSILSILAIGITLVSAQHKFDDLTYKTLFGFIEIGYPTENYTPIFKDCKEINKCFESGPTQYLLGTYLMDKGQEMEVFYSSGSSEDPQLVILLNSKVILRVMGNTFHFKGSIVYVEGDSNNLFDKKRKYQFNGKEFVEVLQAFYSVDVKGRLNHSINIYQDKKGKGLVASLPKGYPIEIILAEINLDYKYNSGNEKYVLIKTKLGLLGWYELKGEDYMGGLIEEFRYFGD